MANSGMVVPIYPAGRGHYALGSPDGKMLVPGQRVEIVLAGLQIVGTVQWSELGDYLQLTGGDRCGLCACMRVVASTIQQEAEVSR